MSERKLNVPLDSDLYLWLTELTIRQQDRGVHGAGRQRIGKDRTINRILEYVRSLPTKEQDRIFDTSATAKSE
jgi:hypothetical protein